MVSASTSVITLLQLIQRLNFTNLFSVTISLLTFLLTSTIEETLGNILLKALREFLEEIFRL